MPDSAASSRSLAYPGLRLLLLILIGVTVVRLIGLHFSVVDLFFDEAQYWAWSREPAFGYFSKPPLLAWVIGMAGTVCGSGEACVRAPAPLMHLATSLLIYAVARALYEDRRVAFWAALTYALMTGAAFSSRIISTDVPLLMFWALALLAYVKLLPRSDPTWAIVLGLALGLGLLAKYAMIYFLLCAVIAAFFDREARDLWRRRDPWIALLIAVILIAPNIWWNAANGFATFRHTGENIEGGGLSFNFAQGLEFIAAQFGVFGPIAFAVLLIAFWRAREPATPRGDLLMLAFALPPIVLITAVAIVTRAHANWAATAFVSAPVVVAALFVRREAWRWLAASLAIGILVQVALAAGDAFAYRLALPLMKNPDVYHRTLGWRPLGEQVKRLIREAGPIKTVAGDRRDDVAALIYYLRDQPVRVVIAARPGLPGDHFELTRPLTAGAAGPILFVTHCDDAKRFERYYAEVKSLGGFDAVTGPTTARHYHVFKLDGARGEIGPLGSC